MEDLDCLWEDDLEGDFIALVRKQWPRDMFVLSATAMLGETWPEDGDLILTEHAPELLEYFRTHYKTDPRAEKPSKKEKKDLAEIYSIAQRFLELGAGEDAAKLALKILETNPEEAPFWLIRSKALMLQGLHDGALEDAKTALSLDPSNLSLMYHYFSVCVVKDQPKSIPRYINAVFKDLNKDQQDELLGYVVASMESGVFGKLDLDPKIMGALVIYRQNRE